MRHVAVALCILLVSVASIAHAQDCNNRRCLVKMTFSEDDELTLDFDPFYVSDRPDLAAVWRIDTTGYRFRRGDGVLLASNQLYDGCRTGNDNGSSCDTGSSSTPRRYRWMVRNTDSFDVKYCVVVTKLVGSKRLYYDPTIVSRIGIVRGQKTQQARKDVGAAQVTLSPKTTPC